MKINFEKSKQIPFNCNSDFNFSVYAEPFKPTSLDAILTSQWSNFTHDPATVQVFRARSFGP